MVWDFIFFGFTGVSRNYISICIHTNIVLINLVFLNEGFGNKGFKELKNKSKAKKMKAAATMRWRSVKQIARADSVQGQR